jgi:hypothetical protein
MERAMMILHRPCDCRSCRAFALIQLWLFILTLLASIVWLWLPIAWRPFR